ncbi:MAG: hypothetical protein CML20_14470 [Rheinheimera sp.]|nr:hypothetical protein [Rheinheimera sp.]|tara:strand:+ start:21250 stop:21561 length:312 start_codon:yes stop_codon:yes gene_type:complete
MAQETDDKVAQLMVETSHEAGLIKLCEKLGFSNGFINKFANGYPENSSFLNESLDCIRTVIETFENGDNDTLEFLQEQTNYDHERLTRAANTFHKYNKKSTKA